MNYRDIADISTKVVAGRLHYFDKIDTIDLCTCNASDILEMEKGSIDRYRNDPIFHAKVMSIVSSLIQELAAIEREEERAMMHTPEPWKTEGGPEIYDATDCLIVYVDGCPKITTAEDDANAARIVACVNACAGIENPEDLRRQRDELKTELDKAYSEIERLKAIEISYKALEKRFIDKCKVTP